MAFIGVIGFLSGIIIFLFCFIIEIIKVISSVGIFKKLGVKGGLALIPLYNVYIEFKLLGINKVIRVLTIISILTVMYVFSFIFRDFNTFMSILMLSIMGIFANWKVAEVNQIIGAISLVISVGIILITSIYFKYKLANKFKKGILWTIGLIIFPYIFYPMIAFNKKIDTK